MTKIDRLVDGEKDIGTIIKGQSFQVFQGPIPKPLKMHYLVVLSAGFVTIPIKFYGVGTYDQTNAMGGGSFHFQWQLKKIHAAAGPSLGRHALV